MYGTTIGAYDSINEPQYRARMKNVMILFAFRDALGLGALRLGEGLFLVRVVMHMCLQVVPIASAVLLTDFQSKRKIFHLSTENIWRTIEGLLPKIVESELIASSQYCAIAGDKYVQILN
ncbi:conserved hypothetical protein [Coccidioides posadasii str. Silveira]|uniref:Uncharacterized protein n=2 Tax=Coccidioides posadasii TaxID=199306 RepID=E9D576_COCPS|nr:conserved hypothetical protein [Coccidioides posadasii str. Silveira]KMM66854.1 hypothetical protein CPAG_03191 [Coccidioides posadasii RMSCC 3488]